MNTDEICSGTFATEERVVYEQAMRPYDLVVDSHRGGDFFARLTYLSIPGLKIYRDAYDHETRLQGYVPGSILAFADMYDASGRSELWQSQVGNSNMHLASDTIVDGVMAAGHVNQGVVLELDHPDIQPFASILERELSVPNSKLRRKHYCNVKALRVYLTRLLDDRCIAEVLNKSKRAEDLFRDDVAQFLTKTLGNANRIDDLRMRKNEVQVMTKVLDYLACSSSVAVSVQEICRECDVNERTVERAFRATFDCTLREYLLRRRFNSARMDLLMGSPSNCSVTAVAVKYGFYDFGRFSGEFRKRFGELPSRTLRVLGQETNISSWPAAGANNLS